MNIEVHVTEYVGLTLSILGADLLWLILHTFTHIRC
jgi:hypothetical protein